MFKDFLIMALLPLLIIMMLALTGCASAHMERTEFRKDGTKVVTEINYNVLGKREFHNLKINPVTGMIELGDSKGSVGDLATTLKNATEIIKKLTATP